jgi:hypothetical protein
MGYKGTYPAHFHLKTLGKEYILYEGFIGFPGEARHKARTKLETRSPEILQRFKSALQTDAAPEVPVQFRVGSLEPHQVAVSPRRPEFLIFPAASDAKTQGDGGLRPGGGPGSFGKS